MTKSLSKNKSSIDVGGDWDVTFEQAITNGWFVSMGELDEEFTKKFIKKEKEKTINAVTDMLFDTKGYLELLDYLSANYEVKLLTNFTDELHEKLQMLKKK